MEMKQLALLAAADREQITQANQSRSHLLHLPAEIRNKIYRYLFSATRVEARITRGAPCASDAYTKLRGSVALMHTCRQVRTEARGLFISATSLDYHWRDAKDLLQYVHLMNKADSEDPDAVTAILVDIGETQYWLKSDSDERISALLQMGGL